MKTFKANATMDEKLAYLQSCRWQLEVSHMPAGVTHKAPDGRVYSGQHVGTLRQQHGDTMKVKAPSGEEHAVDLSKFKDGDHVNVRFINLDAPKPSDHRPAPKP